MPRYETESTHLVVPSQPFSDNWPVRLCHLLRAHSCARTLFEHGSAKSDNLPFSAAPAPE